MFGSLILPTGGARFEQQHHHPSPRDNLSSIPYHPTMSFPFRKLPPRFRRIRASAADTLPRLQLSKPIPTTPNLYQILRIKPNASSLEIKTAYRKLAKLFHPDAFPSKSSSSSSSESPSDGGGACDFMAIHNAYATLSDPTERSRYDLSIQIQSSSSSSSHTRCYSSSSSAIDGNENRSYGMQTRRWETDQCW